MNSATQAPTNGTSSSSPAAEPAWAVLKKRRLGRPLSRAQQQIANLRDTGKNNTEIAAALGVSPKYVAKVWTIINQKRGTKQSQATEFKKPDVAAAAIEAAADPMAASMRLAIERVNEQLVAAGIPGKVSEALVRRLRVKYANAVTATRELRTNEILEMLGKRIDLAFNYLDDKVLADASARDIMLGLGVMIEKRNLLRGEPTAIISHEDRKKLHELFPALIEEARRRGVTVDGQVTEKEVSVEPS